MQKIFSLILERGNIFIAVKINNDDGKLVKGMCSADSIANSGSQVTINTGNKININGTTRL